MTAQPIIVTHVLGSYPVYVELGGLGRLDQVAKKYLPNRRIVMIADQTVHDLYGGGSFGKPTWKGEALTFPSGERSKSRETWAGLSDSLFKRGLGRDGALIALGGGVTGDLVGFIAATYMRGIPYLQIPTTLLAMLDASVGGKTGVDTPHGKNLIGAFHPPQAVMVDPRSLATLPERAYRAGLAEAVKHGLIADQGYFEWMEVEAPTLVARDLDAITRLIHRSIEIKAEVVSGDERESGRRAILNAGHTVAHALEQATNYELPHGEAVALGLVVECEIAERLGIAAEGLRSRVAGLLVQLGLPVRLDRRLKRTSLLDTMSMDKKNRGRLVHFALPLRLGEMHRAPHWTTPVPAEAIGAALAVLD